MHSLRWHGLSKKSTGLSQDDRDSPVLIHLALAHCLMGCFLQSSNQFIGQCEGFAAVGVGGRIVVVTAVKPREYFVPDAGIEHLTAVDGTGSLDDLLLISVTGGCIFFVIAEVLPRFIK